VPKEKYTENSKNKKKLIKVKIRNKQTHRSENKRKKQIVCEFSKMSHMRKRH
jgi:hypothetical protein